MAAPMITMLGSGVWASQQVEQGCGIVALRWWGIGRFVLDSVYSHVNNRRSQRNRNHMVLYREPPPCVQAAYIAMYNILESDNYHKIDRILIGKLGRPKIGQCSRHRSPRHVQVQVRRRSTPCRSTAALLFHVRLRHCCSTARWPGSVSCAPALSLLPRSLAASFVTASS